MLDIKTQMLLPLSCRTSKATAKQSKEMTEKIKVWR